MRTHRSEEQVSRKPVGKLDNRLKDRSRVLSDDRWQHTHVKVSYAHHASDYLGADFAAQKWQN